MYIFWKKRSSCQKQCKCKSCEVLLSEKKSIWIKNVVSCEELVLGTPKDVVLRIMQSETYFTTQFLASNDVNIKVNNNNKTKEISFIPLQGIFILYL
jgi:hypothetical protein